MNHGVNNKLKIYAKENVPAAPYLLGAIEKEAPGKLEELGKPMVEKEIASLKAKHSPEQYAHMLKTAYNGFMIFDKGVRDSPTEFDDAGLDIFLDPIREAAARDGIEL